MAYLCVSAVQCIWSGITLYLSNYLYPSVTLVGLGRISSGKATINDSTYPSDMIAGVQIKQHKENLLHTYDLPLQRVHWKKP
jgi:hypothetical protein